MHTLTIAPDLDHKLCSQLEVLRKAYDKSQSFFFKSDSKEEANEMFQGIYKKTNEMIREEFPELTDGREIRIEPETKHQYAKLVIVIKLPCRS